MDDPRTAVRASLYASFWQWQQFRDLHVVEQMNVVRTLETRCYRLDNRVAYYCHTAKFVSAFSPEVRAYDPNAIDYLLANYATIDPRISDSELCPLYSNVMTARLDRKRASGVAKAYSSRHRCRNCGEPMLILGGRALRSGDEPTSLVFHCEPCDIKLFT